MLSLKEIVEARLKELGIGPVTAANKAGLERTFIRDLLKKNKGTIRTDKIEKLAQALDMSPIELFPEWSEKLAIGTRLVTVTGFVQAGVWTEGGPMNLDEPYEIPVPADPDLEIYELHAVETRGPSMNKVYREGTILVFTNIVDAHENIIPGKRYIIARERAGLREMTVKKVEQDSEGKLWLVPESDDKRFQDPLPVDSDDHDTILIVGRVRYAVTRE